MPDNKKKILVTGAAGFIGSALIKKLLKDGNTVIGIDNLNDYYSVNLKKERLKDINRFYEKSKRWKFIEISITDNLRLNNIFKQYNPEIVVNLAAQAGVRHSLDHPFEYVQSNLVGFVNILEQCKIHKVKNFVFASSSSVYGMNKRQPYSEDHSVDHPVSLYAATKKSNELIAHSYSHLFKIPITGLRLFTVYGPWGRPDMAPMIFADSITKGKPIKVFNYGKMKRDFTYIDDIVEGIKRCCFKTATSNENFDQLSPDSSTSSAPFRIFNIGNSKPIEILKFIQLMENNLEIKANIKLEPLQSCDVEETFSDSNKFYNWTGFMPKTSIEDGIKKFVDWYLSFNKI